MEAVAKLFTLPSNIILLCLIASLLACYWQRGRAVAGALAILAGILYVVLGAGPVSFWLLGSLEYRYPELPDAHAYPDARAVVLLSAHAERTPHTPLSSAVNASSAVRVLETARLWRQRPDLSVIVTGEGAVPGILRDLLVEIGVAPGRIAVENASSNTYESALHVRALVKRGSFFLVTSAGHMPRAMGTFERAGLSPIPAPTEFLTRRNIFANRNVPTPAHLIYSELAVQEYLAIAWYRLTGRL